MKQNTKWIRVVAGDVPTSSPAQVKPKGPSCTKFSTGSKFGTDGEIRYGGSKILRKVAGNAWFS